MSKNRFITIADPTGIFVMINTKKEEVYLCNDCLMTTDKGYGYVLNKTDCEHGAKERKRMNNERTNN